ncbi:MAG: hypothetical protein Q9159_001516 [Coniocarpon cinnabarinum]
MGFLWQSRSAPACNNEPKLSGSNVKSKQFKIKWSVVRYNIKGRDRRYAWFEYLRETFNEIYKEEQGQLVQNDCGAVWLFLLPQSFSNSTMDQRAVDFLSRSGLNKADDWRSTTDKRFKIQYRSKDPPVQS